MAFTAREVIMTFRGQNYLSGAIRRVGRDVGSLSRTTQLQQASKQVTINRQRIAQQKTLAEAEAASLTAGSRNIGLRIRQAGLDQKAARTNTDLAKNYERQRGILRDQLRSMNRISEIQSVAAQRGFKMQMRVPVGVSKQVETDLIGAFNAAQATAVQKANAPPIKQLPAGMAKLSQQQLEREYSAELLNQQRLASSIKTNVADRQILNDTISTQSLESQKLAATTREEAARIDYLTERTGTLTLADEKQIAAQRQLAMQMKALPWERWATGARAIEHTGRVLQMFGLIGVATFGYLAKSAADFTTQTTIAATQAVDVGNRSVTNVQRIGSAISSQIQQILASGQTTAKPAELTKGVYDIFSGVSLPGGQQARIKEGIGLLKQFNTVLTANYGFVQFDAVVQAGITLLNDFNVPLKRMPKALNEMQAAVRFGRMTMDQFLSTFNQAAPAAKAAGYSFNQMADAITFLSRKFPSIRMASTGYARLVETLAKSTQAFKAHGISITDATGKLLPLDQVIQKLIDKYPQLTKGGPFLQNFFKSVTGSSGFIQARRVFTYFATNLQQYRALAKQVESDNNELARSALAAGKSPGIAWAKFTNQLRGLILVIGQGAIPAFAILGHYVERFIKWFAGLSPHTQRLIGFIGALSAAAALLGGTLLWVIGSFAAVVVNLRLMAGFANEGAGIFGVLGFGAKSAATDVAALSTSAEGFISTRLAMLGGIGAIIAAMIIFHKQTGQVINAMGGLGNAIAVVTSAFAAWKLIGYISTFVTIARETAILATGITEVGTAAKIATLETVGLRGALMGIAGLVITATILIIQKKKVVAAGENLTGDTLAKEINAMTGKPKALSTTQQVGAFLFGNTPSPLTLLKRFSNDAFNQAFRGGKGDNGVWDSMIKERTSGIQRISLVYQNWLSLIGKSGSPKALNEFLKMFKQAQLGESSSTASLSDWLHSIGRASFGTQGIRNLDKQLQVIRQHMFQLAHENPFADMNNRAVQAAANNRLVEASLKGVQKANETVAKSAIQQGVVATKTYQQLYRALLVAKLAVNIDPTSIAKQRAYIDALNNLQSNVSKQQSQAAERAATAAASTAKKITPAWQAATQQGIVATAQYTKLYDAVNRAQAAMQKDPTLANQRAYVAANAALDQYVSNATAANQKLADSTQLTFANILSSIKNMYDTILQQNQQNFGTLFQGPFLQSPKMQNFTQWGGKPTGMDLSKDLKSQIGQFRQFNRELNILRKRGAPDALIQQLQQLGPAALPQIKALLQLGGSQLNNYFNMFRKAQKMIHQQTMRDLQQQLKQYRKYGQNIALAIVAGLRDQNVALENELKSMIRRMFPGFGKVAGTSGGGRQQHHQQQPPPTTHHRHHRDTRREQHNHPDTQQVARVIKGPHHVIIDHPRLPWRTFETKHLQEISGKVHIVNFPHMVDVRIKEPKTPWHVMVEPRHNMNQNKEIHHHYEYHVTAPKGSSVDTQVRHANFKHNKRKPTGSRYGN